MSKFVPALEDKAAGMLYHCIPVEPVGDVIRTSTNYGATIPPDVREKLGIDSTEHAPLIFASDHKSKAMAFGLQGILNEKILNASIEGTDAELVLACDRDNMMSRARNGSIWSFPTSGFERLPNMERQLVSDKPIPFAEAKKVMDIKTTEDLLRAGLQIFSFKENLRDLPDRETLLKPMKERNLTMPQFLAELLKAGTVVWENQARGINPHPVLAGQMGIRLKAPAPLAENRQKLPKP